MSKSFPNATINPTSANYNPEWLWFHKGFLEGLKQAPTLSEPDEKIESLLFNFAEAQIELEETRTKLRDVTEALEASLLVAMQKHLQDENHSTSEGASADVKGSSHSFPLAPLLQPTMSYAESLRRSTPATSLSPMTYAESLQLSTAAPSPSARLASAPQPNTRTFSQMVRILVPGYYQDSEGTQGSVDAALRELITKAHEGDARSFAFIKRLCREAHGTPADQKSYGQRYILTRWRNPTFYPRRGRSNIDSTHPYHIPLPNPQRNDPPETWTAFYTQHPRRLPKGVRLDPRTGVPLFGDIVASRLLALFRPTNPQYRAEFIVAMISLFVHRGQFKQMVQTGQVWIPQNSYAKQPFDHENKTNPITALDVAQHYARCGVSVKEVEIYVEPWTEDFAFLLQSYCEKSLGWAKQMFLTWSWRASIKLGPIAARMSVKVNGHSGNVAGAQAGVETGGKTSLNSPAIWAHQVHLCLKIYIGQPQKTLSAKSMTAQETASNPQYFQAKKWLKLRT
ncbi:hypothetical protein F5879DRAFT_918779 [Lentinula edodes]|nr:hypothetical protein F5879DRAFT_918779 [Lentinula edodes]